MKSIAPCFVLVLALPVLTGCGGDDPPPPADVHGNYTLTVTNGPSTCPLPNWNQGSVTPNIPFTVTQNGGSASADVGGLGAVFLSAYCGNAHLEGSVVGTDMDLVLKGTRPLSSGSCAFTIDAHLVATLQGDALTGSISYAPNTNSSPDCAAVQSCAARMNFNGTRPPSGQ
jgi:hypothetical protein